MVAEPRPPYLAASDKERSAVLDDGVVRLRLLFGRATERPRQCLAYEQGLIKLLAVIRKELAGQPFSARYPGYGAVEGSLAQGPEL